MQNAWDYFWLCWPYAAWLTVVAYLFIHRDKLKGDGREDEDEMGVWVYNHPRNRTGHDDQVSANTLNVMPTSATLQGSGIDRQLTDKHST